KHDAMSQIILNGIALADLLAEFRAIVKDEVESLSTNPPAKTGQKFLNAHEAADYLGLSVQTIYQRITAIPHLKRFGRLYFEQDKLEAFLRDAKV
ncbi:MAG: DNA-binding protein, partial [Runella slithyformis]